MRLEFRRPDFSELPECLTLIADSFAYDCAEKEHLLRLWREVLERRCGESSVVESADRAPAERLLAFGMSIFVTDEFMCEVRAGILPYVGRHVLERWLHGRSPLLTLRQICDANSGEGLNILILHRGTRELPPLGTDERARVHHCLMDAFFAYHRGYRVKEFIQELYEEAAVDFNIAAGLTLITDYAEMLRNNPIFASGLAKRPYLLGVTREAALLQPQAFAYQLTEYTPPRFGFTMAEQELLRHALRWEIDEDIASELNVALITVKKRWEGIYDRVSAVDSAFFGEPKWAPRRERRGPEKRRCVLAYVQDHPEELRPAKVKR